MLVLFLVLVLLFVTIIPILLFTHLEPINHDDPSGVPIEEYSDES